MASLEEAVVKGLAGDKGLYMPERIPSLDQSFIQNMKHLSFQEIACTVAQAFFGEDIEKDTLRQIVCDTLSFDTPVVNVTENIYSLVRHWHSKMLVPGLWHDCWDILSRKKD